ncbi:MAG: glycosyltransferase, partial [Nitrospinaceae bacterium]|nr:glycosyltransferase family 2 protein [Nitrospinaceae bacterium]NIR55297.1 glycosyltransferase family 2 protein [Nitrospinaceae bacterium]NIS85736.1 glycosyltransferase family 2 protein [Nitrospinaceae bacterium]NIT82586.1 glycosyltransferase family 2 protein [Nitrospinaceae bacterium]NIU44791.1 glycosyltransferase family 2 protein [Nitrospinaceae bacterium]
MDSSTFLSIIIPAFNEESRLRETLPGLKRFLDRQDYAWEVILVDDGSEDDTSGVLQEFFTPEQGRGVRYTPNRGKGYAIRQGVAAARGEVLLFTDADFSTPITEFPRLVQFLSQGFDIAIGSRSLPESNVVEHQAWYREGMGKVFNLMVRLLLFRGIIDTQCGFKCLRREQALPLFEKLTLDGFSYDVELLYLAKKRGLKIAEVPVTWKNHPESKVVIFRDVY